MIGAYTDIEKIDLSSVKSKIAELEKKMLDRKKSQIGVYNSRLSQLNKRFLAESKKSIGSKKDECVLSYYKEVAKLVEEWGKASA